MALESIYTLFMLQGPKNAPRLTERRGAHLQFAVIPSESRGERLALSPVQEESLLAFSPGTCRAIAIAAD